MPDIHSILEEYWGYDSFRPLQQEIIESVAGGRDTLALLPTGGGKSLCYQVPALAQEGICLVISPLIALMKDQVENLKKRGIMATAIYSGMSNRLIAQTLKNVAYGPYKLLYVSPERLETALFKEFLPALDLNLIAVDEAHCISQWGYDFRPSYLKIAELRQEVPDIPILALTASATPLVQKDICKQLLFTNEQVFRQSYERKNLSYSVVTADSKVAKLVDILKKVPGTAIVYCKSRKRTVEISKLLQLQGISAHHYHAGLSSEERNTRQQDWIDDKVRVMVCTNAFGMGIDKPDVRAVVHIDVPDSLENYYQEAGRAGRDGKKAYAVLLANEKDITELQELHHTRYPSFEQIKEVYMALVNFLQVPVHTGEDQSFDFHFDTFIKNFSLKGTEALYALKALESDGWLTFSERAFMPSNVGFTTNKRQLYDFYHHYPQYEELLTTLLRTYEGIFDYPVFITESTIARLLRKKEEEVKTLLAQVQAFRIIQYTPQNEQPQIRFLKNRVAAEDLRFNLAEYNKRKEAFIARVDKMVGYIRTDRCRSQFLNEYFGDAATPPCGICDTCLRTKTSSLSTAEFNAITTAITTCLRQAPLHAHELLQQLPGISKEKARRVLDFLQAEQKIGINGQGQMTLNG
jgi:ATP-dependent DNA helicase RecQ